MDQPVNLDIVAETKEFMGAGAYGTANWWDRTVAREAAAHLMRTEHVRLRSGVAVLKLRGFSAVDEEVLNQVSKVLRDDKALVIDLRGNPGGKLENLKTLVAMFFNRAVQVGKQVKRGEAEAVTTDQRDDAFTGKLIVLVDSESASAAEVFARVVQIEQRGTVVGDVTAGSVMVSRAYHHELRIRRDSAIQYGASVTDADLVMGDGKSLEHRGVQPDVLLVPAPEDLVDGRDPVLSRAIEMAGGEVTPEEAGRMFPYEWPDL
jgi:carboxyl-terminal processing protease